MSSNPNQDNKDQPVLLNHSRSPKAEIGYGRIFIRSFAAFSVLLLLGSLVLINQRINENLSTFVTAQVGYPLGSEQLSSGGTFSRASAKVSRLMHPIITEENSLQRRTDDDNFRKEIESVKFSEQSKDDVESSTNGAISAAYFVNWAIYGRNHFPWELPFEHLTHVFYAFANVRPETGEIYLSDSWADEQIHWADRGDSWNDEGNNLYGCFNQFRKLKQKHRHLKLLLSIGGWTYSSNFAGSDGGTATSEKRQTFAKSAISLLENYGLDGIDIDWEYPADDTEANRMVDLLKRVREGLTALKEKKGEETPYLLTIAAPCGPSHYKQLHLKEMHQYLSFINLMAYDYAGSWDTVAGHQANLKRPKSKAVNQGNFSTVAAVEHYIDNSVPVHKLVMGMPLYGRSFLNTKGIGEPYNGVGQGTWEQGVYDYKALPPSGSKVVEDPKVVGAYTYSAENQELITFDSPNTVSMKVDYINSKNMGGVMWWESSADKNTTGHALIPLAASKLGTLDTTPNHLRYPDSKWDNLKNYNPPARPTHRQSQGSHKLHHSHHAPHHEFRFEEGTRAVQGSY